MSGKSALAKAIRYALSRWKALVRYLSDGRLEMTNNAAERAIASRFLGERTTCSVALKPEVSEWLASTPSPQQQG